MSQVFARTMSGSLNQKEKGKSNKRFNSQNQADSPAWTHTWSPHSLLLPQMVTKLR